MCSFYSFVASPLSAHRMKEAKLDKDRPCTFKRLVIVKRYDEFNRREEKEGELVDAWFCCGSGKQTKCLFVQWWESSFWLHEEQISNVLRILPNLLKEYRPM